MFGRCTVCPESYFMSLKFISQTFILSECGWEYIISFRHTENTDLMDKAIMESMGLVTTRVKALFIAAIIQNKSSNNKLMAQ